MLSDKIILELVLNCFYELFCIKLKVDYNIITVININ